MTSPRHPEDRDGWSLSVSRRAFLHAATAATVAADQVFGAPEKPVVPSLAPRPVRPVTPLDGRLTAVIPAWLQLQCEKLIEALRRRGVCIRDDAGPAASHRGHVLLVGALESNRWIRHLYLRSWLATDILHPGQGGHELKTLCGAIDPEANVVLIGAADPAGLAHGIEQFLRRIEGKNSIPCLFEARPSAAAIAASRRSEAWLTAEGFAPYRGTWDGLTYMASLGAYATYTGRRDFLEAFKRECLVQLRMGPCPGYHAYFGHFVLFFRMLEHLDCGTKRNALKCSSAC